VHLIGFIIRIYQDARSSEHLTRSKQDLYKHDFWKEKYTLV